MYVNMFVYLYVSVSVFKYVCVHTCVCLCIREECVCVYVSVKVPPSPCFVQSSSRFREGSRRDLRSWSSATEPGEPLGQGRPF